MMQRAALAFSFVLLLAGLADAQTPRKGGTIRMTAPYGTNISNMDMHATPRAQDDIYGKVVHRTLYNYDSVKGEPVLELAKSVTVSNNGLTHTFKLRDDAFFHNGKKMTADDIIYSFNAHHGRQTRLRGRALCAHHQGRGRGREGAGHQRSKA